jgi:pyruvate formate lyase activating enzyme
MQRKTVNKIRFAGIEGSSTIDYPGKVAAVIYLCGCPYRCPWCQNAELVVGKGRCKNITVEGIIAQLKKNFIAQAVCITGGEPLMQKETIRLLTKIKDETDFLLKIDTNSHFPERLKEALPYLDFITTDIKAPLDERYGRVVGLPEKWEKIVANVSKSLDIMKTSIKNKEARTTIVPGLIDRKEDITEIAEIVRKNKFTQYTLQQFRAEKTLDPAYMEVVSPSLTLMRELGRAAKEHLPDTKVVVVTQQKGFEEMR